MKLKKEICCMVWLPDAATGKAQLIIVFNEKDNIRETQYFAYENVPFELRN